MLPIHDVEQKLAFINSELRDIVIEIRNLVAEIAPDAVEVVHSKGFSYYHQGKGGPVSAGICQTAIYPGCVRLAFNHGVFLQDPKGYLQGNQLVKRYLELSIFDQVNWDDIQVLISESAQFDPRKSVNDPKIDKDRLSSEL